MQTFLPEPSFLATARVLDYRRLGKQRVECKQILNALTRGAGWANHPATLMWSGHEATLCLYATTITLEWRRRGYRDSLLPEFVAWREELGDLTVPPWLGDPDFHRSHQSNLIRKDLDRYGLIWPTVPADLPYIWPVSKENT